MNKLITETSHFASFEANLPRCPKNKTKVIYWDKKEKEGRAFIMVGYCPDSLDYALSLFMNAQKSFKRLKLSDTIFGKIKKSSCYDGYTFISFSVKSKPRGWEIREMNQLDLVF